MTKKELVNSEGKELDGEQKKRCPLLNQFYHHCVYLIIEEFVGIADATLVSHTCHIAIFVTKHLLGEEVAHHRAAVL